MKTLVIPDIHEDWQTAEAIVERYGPEVERIVCLGDYFDSFTSTPESVERTAQMVERWAADPRFTLLFGNHDLQYAFPQVRELLCTGFNGAKLDRLALVPWRAMKLVEILDGLVLSHAGVHPNFTMHASNIKSRMASILLLQNQARTQLANGVMHPFVAVGRSRGGDRPFGGTTWLDWEYEFNPIRGVNQIVGHTPGDAVRQNGSNYCIDTGLKHVAILGDGIEPRFVTVGAAR